MAAVTKSELGDDCLTLFIVSCRISDATRSQSSASSHAARFKSTFALHVSADILIRTSPGWDRRRQQWCPNSLMQLRCPKHVKSSSVYLNRTVTTSTQTQSRPSSFPVCATEIQFPCGTIWNATTARSCRSTLLCPPAPPAKSGWPTICWTRRLVDLSDAIGRSAL